MTTQKQAKESVVAPSTTPVVGGRKAIVGALARMSADSNHPRGHRHIPSPVDFQQWGDWDNGHTDG